MGIFRAASRAAFDSLGGSRIARWKNRGGLRILMYHRFPRQASLASQCEHLRKHYTLLSLDAVAIHLESVRPFPPNSVAVTVDDGYHDFLDVAYSTFSRFGIPVTLFVVSRFIDGDIWLWPDVVRYVFAHSPLSRVKIELFAGDDGVLDLSSPEKRIDAGHCVTEKAKAMNNSERLALLQDLPELLSVPIPEKPPLANKPLSWNEVRQISGAGVDIGAHTKNHPILSRLSSAEDVRDEIGGSKASIEAQLQKPVKHFCYPNGKTSDIGTAAIEAVRSARYSSAVTTEVGLNDFRAGKFLLTRIGVEPDLPQHYFERCIAGHL